MSRQENGKSSLVAGKFFFIVVNCCLLKIMDSFKGYLKAFQRINTHPYTLIYTFSLFGIPKCNEVGCDCHYCGDTFLFTF